MDESSVNSIWLPIRENTGAGLSDQIDTTEQDAQSRNMPYPWTIPEPLGVCETRGWGDAPIVLRRHGNPDGLRLVVSHANGLSADSYFPFWSLLLERFDVVVYDFRNHGWNPVGDLKAHQMPVFARDNACVARAIDLHFGSKPMVGVFHSMSASTAVLQATQGRPFSALVLFDPPTCADARESQDIRKVARQLAARARKRQSLFATREEYAERLLAARAFERLRPGAAEWIAHTTLRPADEGTGYQLSCPPAYEARIFEQLYDSAVAADIANLACPTKIIGADPTVPFSFLPSVNVSELVSIEYDFVPETTHFLQLEQPEECVALTVAFLEKQGLA